MNQIGELNVAIVTLRSECKKHTDCRECPMYINCAGSPCSWERIDDSNESVTLCNGLHHKKDGDNDARA